MIIDEHFSSEFIAAIERFYPKTAVLLSHCYVKVIKTHWGQPPKPLQYVGIYCPEPFISSVRFQLELLREVAHYLGLTEVVCVNATRLVRDPKSSLKESDSRFWLELCWIAQ